MEVEYPLHTGSKVIGGDICFFVCVHVYPFNAVADVELPVQTVVFCSPFICQASNQFTMGVYLQQRIGQVGQIFKITKGLAVQDVEAFDFTGCQSCDDQVLDFVRRSFCFVLFTFFRLFSGLFGRFFSFLRFFCLSSFTGVVAASTQQHRCCQCQSQQFGYSLFHIVLLQLSKKACSVCCWFPALVTAET